MQGTVRFEWIRPKEEMDSVVEITRLKEQQTLWEAAHLLMLHDVYCGPSFVIPFVVDVGWAKKCESCLQKANHKTKPAWASTPKSPADNMNRTQKEQQRSLEKRKLREQTMKKVVFLVMILLALPPAMAALSATVATLKSGGEPQTATALKRIRRRRLGSGWTQLGQTIHSNFTDNLGFSVALSKDGLRVAMGATTFSDKGRVLVYQISTQQEACRWEPVGNTIMGDGAGDMLGHAVALSDDGGILAVSGDVSETGSRQGFVNVYQFDDDSTWKQIGHVTAEKPFSNFGHTLDISGDGKVVAVGAHGYCQVYQYSQEEWVPKGQIITVTEKVDDLYKGKAIARLSSDGNLVGVASPDERNARIFRYGPGLWTR
jgi:hypothetical protein